MTKIIKIALIKRGMTRKELAKRINSSPSNLSNKMRRDNFTEGELREIANVLDCDFNASFTLRDTGEQIT